MAAKQARRRQRNSDRTTGPRILLVAAGGKVRPVEDALTAAGWAVQRVSGARAAAVQLADDAVDLVLVAERPTPRATLAVLRQLLRSGPGQRRIVLGASGSAADLLSYANQGGAQRVLPPPVAPRDVVAAVRATWEEQEAERVALLRDTDAGAVAAQLQARMRERTQEVNRANRELRRTLRELAQKNRALATLNESLRVQSTTDPLTGLYNRREFLTRIRTEWGRFRRYGRPLSLIMLDIDHFKQINDTHGHECGDVVLRELGQLVSHNKRAQDLCCRYGGEEFVVLLTETTLDAAFHVAEGLRRLIGEHAFRYDGQDIPVRVSLGVSGAMEQGPADVEKFINMADKAMYRAKREGRDRTVVLDASDESRIARQSRAGPPPRRDAATSRSRSRTGQGQAAASDRAAKGRKTAKQQDAAATGERGPRRPRSRTRP